MYIELGLLIALVVMVIWWRLDRRAQEWARRNPDDPRVVGPGERQLEEERELIRYTEDSRHSLFYKAIRNPFVWMLIAIVVINLARLI